MLTLIADENIPHIHALAEPWGKVITYPGRHITADTLKNADALLIRSVTPVTMDLLAHTSVKFVGSCTAGMDHVDVTALQQQGIHCISAPGCNARSVAEYVLASLLTVAAQYSIRLQGKTLAIIGYGHVGQAVTQLMGLLDIKIIICDPPLQQQNKIQGVSLQQALTADIICLHAPLITQGPFTSHYLIGEKELKQIAPDAILLNAGRGALIDNEALYQHLQKNPSLHCILDVWENEPRIHPLLAQLCRISTPHIAGYSLDSKIKSAHQIIKNMVTYFYSAAEAETIQLPNTEYADKQKITADLIKTFSSQDQLYACVKQRYDLKKDHQALQETLHLSAPERAIAFDQLRKNYPERREFSA